MSIQNLITQLNNLSLKLTSIQSSTAESKIMTASLIADPDFTLLLNAAEQKWVTDLDTVLAAAPIDYAYLSYTLTVTAGANGSVSPSGSVVVNYGNGITFTATPDMGYAVNEWLVDSIVVQTGGTTFTIDTVYGDATVDVTFV